MEDAPAALGQDLTATPVQRMCRSGPRPVRSGILGRVWELRFVGLLLSALALSACQPRNVSFVLRFQNGATRGATAAIRVRILSGDCSGPAIYATAFDPATPSAAATPPRLAPGTYAFEAEARNASCEIIARTCVVEELPLQGAELSLTLMDEAATPACAPSQCDSGVCEDDTPDAGPPPPDSGVDTGVIGPECTSDAMCPDGRCRGGMCCNGCWTGSACVAGTSDTACGTGGDECASCGSGEECRANACATAGPPATLSLGVLTSYLRVGDHLWSAGDNAASQRGELASTTPNVFAQQDTDIQFVDVAAAQLATCGIDASGSLWCWGRNALGLLGINSTDSSLVHETPQRVGSDRWIDVAAGNSHFCAIRADEHLLCWGANTEGRLGVGTSPTFRAQPTEVEARGTWRMVAPGDTHTCGIRTDGTLACWGTADDGRLGAEGATTGPAPVEVGGTDWVAVTAGVRHTCGIRGAAGSRTLHCWGLRMYGLVGDAMTSGAPAETPVEIGDALDWAAVDAGEYHTCALTGDRALYCWGVGSSYGQLGLGRTDADVPTRVTSGFDLLGVGWSHTCAVTLSGGAFESIQCWGDNTGGMLGIGTTDTLQDMPLEATLDPAP